jgi:hypothetical protein
MATKQKDPAPDFFKLIEAHDVRGQPWDELNPSQHLVLTILAFEEHRALSLNLGHRTIAKMNSSMDLHVEIRERHTLSGHMVCGTIIQYPASTTTVLLETELNK